MDDYRLTLTLEGPKADRGEIRLGVLIHELQALSSLLSNLDRALSPEGKLSTNYMVVELHHSSPAEIVIGGQPKKGSPDIRAAVFSAPFETVERIEEGNRKGLDYGLVESLFELARPVGNGLRSAELSRNGNQTNLTMGLKAKLDQLLRVDYTFYGFIQGRLEAANVHAGANSFRLYPRSGPAKIVGNFPADLSSTVGAALGKDVVVRGLLHYRADAPHAHAILAESIEILPDVAELLSLHELPAALGGFTGGLTSEEWLEQRRAEALPELLKIFGA